MEPIGQLVAATFKRMGRDKELLEPRCIVGWVEVAGPRVAARAQAERLKGGVLTVRVDSAAWLQELSYLKSDLRERLNEHLGVDAVREIRLLPGKVPHPLATTSSAARVPAPPSSHAPAPLDEEAATRVRDQAAAIHDPALRDAMVALSRKLAGRPPRR